MVSTSLPDMHTVQGATLMSTDDDEKKRTKAGRKFRFTGRRGKSFTTIARSMFAKHNKAPVLVHVDMDPFPPVPEPSPHEGCIFLAPLPPSERNLASGVVSVMCSTAAAA